MQDIIMQLQKKTQHWRENEVAVEQFVLLPIIILITNSYNIPWQRTPASSKWIQLSIAVYVQSTSRLSDPVHRTSSRWMGPLPWPKKEKLKAVAPVSFTIRKQLRHI